MPTEQELVDQAYADGYVDALVADGVVGTLELAHELAEAKAEIRRHHQDFADISHYAESALETGDYQTAIQQIRSVVG